jgi:hypothetical protein
VETDDYTESMSDWDAAMTTDFDPQLAVDAPPPGARACGG